MSLQGVQPAGIASSNHGCQSENFMLFSFSDYEHIANGLTCFAGLEETPFTIARYENGELHVTISSPVARNQCLILGTIAPPDEHLLSLTLLAHTLKTQGAARVTGILPYLAYTRQDKLKAGESLATAWSGLLLQASGIDVILTIDVHSERSVQLFPVPLISLSPSHLFAAEIIRNNLKDATLVAPDHGALPRCHAVLTAAGLLPAEIPYFEKKRTESGIVHSSLMGRVNSRVILVDDILDTRHACFRLRKAEIFAGAGDIHFRNSRRLHRREVEAAMVTWRSTHILH